MSVDSARVEQYRNEGYLCVRGLFSREETNALSSYFMAMVERGGDGWAEGGVHPDDPDPLKRYPRLLQPHRGDEVAMRYMIDVRIRSWLTAFYEREPLAVQTMVYFKPPGARGQSLHQDQRYLRADPGTCMAAWLALDDMDEENGCLRVVPGTQSLPILCPGESNPEESFSSDEVPLPDGLAPVSLPMKAGDMLFFNGSLVHGSGPNRSPDRFRRIIVGHYISGEAELVTHYYFPVFDFEGHVVVGLNSNEWGGPCGVLTERDGRQVIDMVGSIDDAKSAH